MRYKFGLVGPGRVGTSLVYLLHSAEFNLKAVIGRSQASLERAETYLTDKDGLPAPVFSTELRDIPQDLDFIILGVKDDQIGLVVQCLWEEGLLVGKPTLIHLSGVHGSDVGLNEEMSEMRAIPRLALHPLQSVADVEVGISKLPESVWSLEGDPAAIQLGKEILTHLNVQWMEITKEQKPLYHAAACVVSNYLVTIANTGIQMLMEVGFSQELAQQALLPLIQGTVGNLKGKTPKKALTGPIARGDISTIEKHLQVIAQTNKDWLERYQVLGKGTVEYAPLSVEVAEELLKKLSEEE